MSDKQDSDETTSSEGDEAVNPQRRYFAVDADTIADINPLPGTEAFAENNADPLEDAALAQTFSDDPLASSETHPEGEPTIWDWFAGHEHPRSNETRLLDKQIDYFLRKWSAIEVYNADVAPDAKPSAPTITRVSLSPRRWLEARENGEEDDEGGSGGGLPISDWFIHDDDLSLKTGQPDLYAESTSLQPFMAVLEKVIAMAGDKGWQSIGFVGFGPDLAWVSVQEYNIKNPERALQVINYMPEEPALERYSEHLRESAQRSLKA